MTQTEVRNNYAAYRDYKLVVEIGELWYKCFTALNMKTGSCAQ